MRDDLETYRSALTWLIGRGRPAEAAHIAWALRYFWVIRGHAAEGLRWHEQILKLPSLPPLAESRALLGVTAMSYTQGELGRARIGLPRALALAHAVGDMNLVAQAEHLFGHVEDALGNAHAARDRFTRSAEGFQALAIPWGTGSALIGMAKVALSIGDADEAERLLAQATAVLRDSGPWFLALAPYLRAVLAVQRGDPDRAIALVGESLTRIRELHDKFALVYALVPLAAAAADKGDDGWAVRILGARDTVTERTGATVVDKSVHDLRERAERKVRGRLGPDRWAQAYAAGRKASIDALLQDINAALHNPTVTPTADKGAESPV